MNHHLATRARALGGAFALAAGLAAPGAAGACTCFLISFETEYAGTSHVFTARSLGSRSAAPAYPDHHYEMLAVHAIWKGGVGATVEVLVADHSGICGGYLLPGTDYLVFAHEGSAGSPLFTHSCTRTGAYPAQDPIWQQLGPPLTTPAGSASWGGLKAAYHR